MSSSLQNKFNAVVLAGAVTMTSVLDVNAEIALPENTAPLTFSEENLKPYVDQNVSGKTPVVNGSGFKLKDNSWVALPLQNDITVTQSNRLTLNVTVDIEGEICGLIALKRGLDPSYQEAGRPHTGRDIIRFCGTQDYIDKKEALYDTSALGTKQEITILLSDYYDVGTDISNIVFIGDDDIRKNTDVTFSDIKIYDGDISSAEVLKFSENDLVPYADQHKTVSGAKNPEVEGTELGLEGNSWSYSKLNNKITVTENTYVTLDATVDKEGEICGLLFLEEGIDPSSRDVYGKLPHSGNNIPIVRLCGTQSYSNMRDALYDTSALGTMQEITFSLSDYIPEGSVVENIVFIGDDDANNGSDITFGNIKIYDNTPNIGLNLECDKDQKEYIGGAGIDTIDCSNLDKTVEIDLKRGDGRFGKGAEYKFTSIENIFGTDLATMQGDFLYGNSGDNYIAAGSGTDVIKPRGGTDFIDGGDGFDLVEYTDSSEAVTIDVNHLSDYGLPAGQGGDAEGDEYRFVEAFGGSEFNDTFIGDDNKNVFHGHGGNDTYDLGAGNDQVTDSGGDDTYIYTSGADIYYDTDGNDTVIFKGNISSSDAYVYQNIITFDNENYITFNDINQIETFRFEDQESGHIDNLTLGQFISASAGVGEGNPQPDPDNNNPVLGADNFTVDEDTTTELYPLDNDSDPDNDYLTITSCTSPMNGAILTWAVEEDNSILYTPKSEYNGTDGFSCTVMDDRGGQSTQRVNITVQPDISEVETYVHLVLRAHNRAGFSERSKPAMAYKDSPYATISFDKPTQLENGACINDDVDDKIDQYKIEIGVAQGVYNYQDIWSANAVNVSCQPNGKRDEKCDVDIETCVEEDYYIEGFYNNFEQ